MRDQSSHLFHSSRTSRANLGLNEARQLPFAGSDEKKVALLIEIEKPRGESANPGKPSALNHFGISAPFSVSWGDC
jgi:hypothetical protein